MGNISIKVKCLLWAGKFVFFFFCSVKLKNDKRRIFSQYFFIFKLCQIFFYFGLLCFKDLIGIFFLWTICKNINAQAIYVVCIRDATRIVHLIVAISIYYKFWYIVDIRTKYM